MTLQYYCEASAGVKIGEQHQESGKLENRNNIGNDIWQGLFIRFTYLVIAHG